MGSKHLDVCRCCLKEDGYKDIFTDCIDSGQSTTYEGILKDTFNIQILQDNSEFPRRMICKSCIKILREANIFKQMVMHCEVAFLEYLKSLQCITDQKNMDPELKIEDIKLDEPEDSIHFDIGCADNDSCDEDDETLANLKVGLSKPDGATLNRRKRKRLQEKKIKSKRCKIKDIHEIVSNGDTSKKDWTKISERRGTGPLLRENSLKVIKNSTLCVFQWNKSRYRCFVCKEPFSDINMLREHTITTHTIENIEKTIIHQQNRLVKVEISILSCRICRKELEDMSHLKQHLSETHGMEIKEDLLVPFKIENELCCQICYEKFTVFRLLNIHMNKHYQKQVCHICGAGFSNLVFLNLHRTRSHRSLNCKKCDVSFKSKTDKKHHDATVHGIKIERKTRFPCPFCPERFFQENFRVLHLIKSHGMATPEFKCGICTKNFLTRSLRNNHVKNVHNKEKNQECDVCHHFFYTKSDLLRHKLTHTGEKKFSCELCNNLFATRDTLRRHLKRIHVGVI